MSDMSRCVRALRVVVGTAVLMLCNNCLGAAPTESTATTPDASKFTALVDGTRWRPISYVFSPNQYGGFSLFATDIFGPNRFSVSLSVGHVVGVGTYPLTGDVGPFDGGTASISNGTAYWGANGSGGSGTLTVTSATATRIAGTFQFTAVPTAGFGGTRYVTEGEFDLPTQGTGFDITPLNAAYRFDAVADGTACSPRNASISGVPGDRFSLSVGCTENRTIGLDLSNFVGTGTYPLGTGGTRVMSFFRSLPSFASQSYGGTNALSAGTVTITTYTPGASIGTTRVAGTFSATLSSATAGTSPVQLSGSFDVRK